MRIISLSTIKVFWELYPAYNDAKDQLLAWYRHALKADWATPIMLKRDVVAAGILQDGRAVFHTAGNIYRLIVWINYPYRVVYIRCVGTLKQHDQVDAQTI